MNLSPEELNDLYDLMKDMEWVSVDTPTQDNYCYAPSWRMCPICGSEIGQHAKQCDLHKWLKKLEENIIP